MNKIIKVMDFLGEGYNTSPKKNHWTFIKVDGFILNLLRTRFYVDTLMMQTYLKFFVSYQMKILSYKLLFKVKTNVFSKVHSIVRIR